MAIDDHELLKMYVRRGSEEAFGDLVARHADLVSRVVQKRVSDAETARDVIQEVFCCLAKKAPRLRKHPALGGWLVKVAVLESHRARRREMSRMKRESLHMVAEESRSEVTEYTEQDFRRVEDALVDLPMATRDAIVLRFYHQKSFRVIGERLGKSEDAAQKLVSRGVERLRKMVGRSEATILGILTSALVMKPSTVEAAQSISLAALNSVSASAPTNVFLSMMTAKQIKLVVALGIGALIPVAYQWKGGPLTDPPARAPLVVQQVDLPEGASMGAPAAAISATTVALPGRSVPKLSTPQDWKARRSNALIADLSDEEWKIRRGAAATIKGSDLPAGLVVPALAKALTDEEWQVRKEAALALASYGEEADSAAPGLIEALRDEEWHVRNASAMALVSVPNKAAVPALSSALADEEWHVAANAATALGRIGAEAADATPALLEVLDHEQWHVRNGAAYALGAIGVSDAVDQLRSLLQDEEAMVVKTAAEALMRLEEGI